MRQFFAVGIFVAVASASPSPLVGQSAPAVGPDTPPDSALVAPDSSLVPQDSAGASFDLAAREEPRRLRLEELRAHPDAYVGAMLRWEVQFLAVQRADSLRSDMDPGEVYLLLRNPGGEAGLVYAVVPPELRARVDVLIPLERIEVIARVRTTSSRYTGHPVIELIAIESQ